MTLPVLEQAQYLRFLEVTAATPLHVRLAHLWRIARAGRCPAHVAALDAWICAHALEA